MNTNRARIALSILALAAIACTLTGCGSSLCSRDQFFNTAFGEDHREHAKTAAVNTPADPGA